jgi:hypothetical protein
MKLVGQQRVLREHNWWASNVSFGTTTVSTMPIPGLVSLNAGTSRCGTPSARGIKGLCVHPRGSDRQPYPGSGWLIGIDDTDSVVGVHDSVYVAFSLVFSRSCCTASCRDRQ